MKIVSISDTHNKHRRIQLPDGDILVVSGDVTSSGGYDEIVRFCDWVIELLDKEKYKDVVWCGGNHDFALETPSPALQEYLENAGTYLNHSSAVVQGLKFFGSPYTPRFYDWAFNVDRGAKLKALWDQIPADTDVLITHGPPYGILDEVPRPPGKYDTHMRKRDEYHSYPTEIKDAGLSTGVGCVDLREALDRIQPKLHVFGHIHCGYGQVKVGKTICVNAATCNEQYQPNNPPIVVEI